MFILKFYLATPFPSGKTFVASFDRVSWHRIKAVQWH